MLPCLSGLPLGSPTGMPGNNQAESGSSRDPVGPPSAAAAAAMNEAFGLDEIVALIMVNLRAGNEGDAVQEACNAVATWLSMNRHHNQVSQNDDTMWAALMQNIFPNAPIPTTHSPWLPESALPTSNREWFYAMCNRHRIMRRVNERKAQLEAQLLEAKREEMERQSSWQRFQAAYPELTDEDTDMRKSHKRYRIAQHQRQMLELQMRIELKAMEEDGDYLAVWNPNPNRLPPLPERQNAWVDPLYYFRREYDDEDPYDQGNDEDEDEE